MNPLRRIAVVLLAGLLILLALGNDSAYPADEKTTAEADGPLGLAINPRAGLQLAAATEYLGEEDWKNAVRLLQHLLDDKSDALARLAGRDGKAERYVSVRAEVERLLAAMPQAGRDVYQRTFGPRAAELLEQARKDKDAELFAAIARRYLYTESGPAALRELARRHYRIGRLHFAAHNYARLVEHLDLARWTNEDLYQATAAFQMRSTSVYADRTLKQLLARSRQNIVRLGERTLTVEQLRKEIERALPPRQARQWPLYGGDATRTAQGSGGAPFLEPLWRQSMIYSDSGTQEDSPTRRLLLQAEKRLRERHRPILSTFAPITTMFTRGEKKASLLIYKNYWGIVALDAKTNEIVWAAPSKGSLQIMLSNRGAGSQSDLSQWLNFYLREDIYPRILFGNSTVGTLSTDGKYVYVVEDLTVPPPGTERISGLRWGRGGSYSSDIQDAIQHNRLQAFSLSAGGKLTWELGGGDDKGPLADCYFLAPPLPLDGLLYVLIEKKQQICLVCLDAAKFKIVSLRPLLRVAVPLADDPYRRIRAAHLAYRDGILVCPTNAGMILGIDLVSGSVAWAYPYREIAAPLARSPVTTEQSKTPRGAAEQPKTPSEIKAFSWSWQGWRMWGSDRIPPTLAIQRRAVAVPKRNWNPGDIPPGWIVGPDGRSVPYLPPLSVFDLEFGKIGSRPVRDVVVAPPAPRRPGGSVPAGWKRDAEGWLVREPAQLYHWAASAPVLAGGHVVFTPPDAPSIHCLRLHDGSLAWSRKKKDDELYLGGVYDGTVLIVSTSGIQGVDLASGKTRWTLPTGIPSGRGIASEGVYYLPLKESTRSKRPEILALDINKGQIVAHIQARPRTPGGTDFDVPGNLLFLDGDFISLTPWEIVAYPPLKGKISQVTKQLAGNHNDSAALTERAALRLDDGDTAGAVEDLRNAMKNKPDATIRYRARSLLFEALTALFQRDLRTAEKYLKEYEDAARVDLESVPEEERAKRRTEQNRRRMRYYLLVARLRESQGRMKDALRAYLDLGALGPGDEMIPLPDEPAVKVRRAIWVRGRIADLLRRASPAQRKELEEEMLRQLKDREGRKDVRSLRGFVMRFGSDMADLQPLPAG